jgi:6-phosphogluconate dehydrogenase
MSTRMATATNDIGIIGLGVMGSNLALNMADHGFAVAVYNRTDSVTREFALSLSPGQRVELCYSLERFVESLLRPRKAMIMVKAGSPVDAVIAELEVLLEPGDVLIDGGNSHYSDTERRGKSVAAEGLGFLGVGISGGERGARTGPSIMPGGPKEAYELVRTIFEAIAAKADGEPCVSYLGPGAVGHYVKMVHNGIEYGVMQLIADSYALLKQVLGLSNEELAAVYWGWDAGELNSYLVEITAQIFRRRDDKTSGHLVDLILGEAGQLGTGMWASQSAMSLQVPVPNIDIAVAMRNLSALEEERPEAKTRLRGAAPADEVAARASPLRDGLSRTRGLKVENVRGALYAATVITYAQGFAHLRAASQALGWTLRLEDVASIWRGGCIVRAALLRDIKTALQCRPELPNLLLDPHFSQAVAPRRQDLASAIAAGMSAGVPAPGLMAALAYLDSYRAEWLPSNLIQAQRDYFGAHTYRRVDEDGVFHTDWSAGPEG